MDPQPARGLGVIDAALIVVGSIIGAGIFLVSPFVAKNVASPAAFLGVWLMGGAVALAGALSNGELGSMFPRSGGEYVYLREAYGPAVGFLSGWTSFWIMFPGSIAALAAGFGATVAPMLGLTGGAAGTSIGVAAVIVLTAVNAFGMAPGKWTQNVLSAVKLAAFVGLLGVGFFVRRAGSTEGAPFFASGDRAGGVALALLPVFFAFSGWNAAAYVGGEMRDPRRGLGRALALGTGLCVLLYVLINAVYLRAMPLAELAHSSDPARATALALGGTKAAAVLSPLIALCVLRPRCKHPSWSLRACTMRWRVTGCSSRRSGKCTLGRKCRFWRSWSRRSSPSCSSSAGASIGCSPSPCSAILIGFSSLTVGAVPLPAHQAPGARALLSRARLSPGAALLSNRERMGHVELARQWRARSPSVVWGGIVATGIPAYVAFRAQARRQETVR